MLPCICPVIDHRGRQNVVRTSVTHSAIASCATFLFSPHFDVICDLLLDRCTATWNLFVNYNIARALVLSKSYWAIMNKIFMYARPCSIKWRVQFHFSCKISVEFMCKFLCLSSGNVKIILNNPNLTSSLWLLPGKDVYFNVSILTSFVFIFIEYLYCVWRVFGYVFILNSKLNSTKRIFHWRWF